MAKTYLKTRLILSFTTLRSVESYLPVLSKTFLSCQWLLSVIGLFIRISQEWGMDVVIIIINSCKKYEALKTCDQIKLFLSLVRIKIRLHKSRLVLQVLGQNPICSPPNHIFPYEFYLNDLNDLYT